MPHDKDDAVIARLEAAMRALGVNQKEFAEGAGISVQSMNGVMTGRRPLSLETAKKLRTAYRLDLEYLFYGVMDHVPLRLAKAITGDATMARE